MSYWRFFAMIITSTIVMLGLMYLNTYALDHIFFSETRTYMAIYMGAVMAFRTIRSRFSPVNVLIYPTPACVSWLMISSRRSVLRLQK